MTSSSIFRRPGARSDACPALTAVVIAHHTHLAAERAATAREPRRAHAARRAADALAHALVELERLILTDRAARVAHRSRANPLPVPGTVTPSERAWVLGWHLLAAATRLHGAASTAGCPIFGERAAADAVALIRQALSELQPLLAPERRIQLRAGLTPATPSWMRSSNSSPRPSGAPDIRAAAAPSQRAGFTRDGSSARSPAPLDAESVQLHRVPATEEQSDPS